MRAIHSTLTLEGLLHGGWRTRNIYSSWSGLSVVVKEGVHVVKGPSIVKGDSHETVGSVVERLSGEFSLCMVHQLIISKSENA